MSHATQEQLEDMNHHSLWTLGEISKLGEDKLGLVKSLEYVCKMLCYDDYINEVLQKDYRQALIYTRDSLYLSLKRGVI